MPHAAHLPAQDERGNPHALQQIARGGLDLSRT
jgi:hypothetical protein